MRGRGTEIRPEAGAPEAGAKPTFIVVVGACVVVRILPISVAMLYVPRSSCPVTPVKSLGIAFPNENPGFSAPFGFGCDAGSTT